jgi:hypothetical protein
MFELPTTPEIERTLAAMKAAQHAHAKLIGQKFDAIGKRVGQFAPELDGDAEILASYERQCAAERAYESAERKFARRRLRK